VRTRHPILCIVTIHGIGFQQPPLPGIPGYADSLHEGLSNYLDASLLSDDPQRPHSKHGDGGPIYVQSCWPPGSNNREAGLARLGLWRAQDLRSIDSTHAPLTNGQGRIAHIALVYSNLEERSPQVEATLLSLAMLLFSLSQYTSLPNLARMLFRDLQALYKGQNDYSSASVLRVRRDPGFIPLHRRGAPDRLLTILRQLENEVAAYVCHDALRARIRHFVVDALLRLACREDVAGIIINAHSNGTVIAYDALRQLPPFAITKIKAFITVGSPLRKYVHLFKWGRAIENSNQLQSWLNYWDTCDPVADPLAPPLRWQRETPLPTGKGLFHYINPLTGEISPLPLTDIQVDNLHFSAGGGLQAHNYWDNDTQFIQPFAALLKKSIAEQMESAQVIMTRITRRR
jgi:hypothetical protein